MQNTLILWADDEIELLKPHIMFLEGKGYKVKTATNGTDALDMVKEEPFDVVFLDENMPGLTGIETLAEIKSINNDIPVVLITKNEEEYLMEDAIGSKIADYLIKPVNPNQILMTLKKLFENKRLVTEKTNSAYQQSFRNLGMTLNEKLSHTEWVEVYKKLLYWELELEQISDNAMKEIFKLQKAEANLQFGKFVAQQYLDWCKGDQGPMLSNQVLKEKVFPELKPEVPTVLLVIDNLRYDQWKIIHKYIAQLFKMDKEDAYYSILPTATHYARNALFAGLMPSEIERLHSKYWLNEEDEGGKNMYEGELLTENIKRNLRKDIRHKYIKVTNTEDGKGLVDQAANLLNNDLLAIVYNFVDMLSHARTEMEIIKELASDEAAYRSLTESWFEHSPLYEFLKKIASKKIKLFITTDHGTVRVQEPVKIVGDRNTNSNLRYKTGRNLNHNSKNIFEIKKPEEAFLPKGNISSTFVFAKDDAYFVYPNNYNYYANFYRDTFQHGGVSLEEIIIPFISYSSK
jgi:CheY-like chemotaxis protein